MASIRDGSVRGSSYASVTPGLKSSIRGSKIDGADITSRARRLVGKIKGTSSYVPKKLEKRPRRGKGHDTQSLPRGKTLDSSSLDCDSSVFRYDDVFRNDDRDRKREPNLAYFQQDARSHHSQQQQPILRHPDFEENNPLHRSYPDSPASARQRPRQDGCPLHNTFHQQYCRPMTMTTSNDPHRTGPSVSPNYSYITAGTHPDMSQPGLAYGHPGGVPQMSSHYGAYMNGFSGGPAFGFEGGLEQASAQQALRILQHQLYDLQMIAQRQLQQSGPPPSSYGTVRSQHQDGVGQVDKVEVSPVRQTLSIIADGDGCEGGGGGLSLLARQPSERAEVMDGSVGGSVEESARRGTAGGGQVAGRRQQHLAVLVQQEEVRPSWELVHSPINEEYYLGRFQPLPGEASQDAALTPPSRAYRPQAVPEKASWRSSPSDRGSSCGSSVGSRSGDMCDTSSAGQRRAKENQPVRSLAVSPCVSTVTDMEADNDLWAPRQQDAPPVSLQEARSSMSRQSSGQSAAGLDGGGTSIHRDSFSSAGGTEAPSDMRTASGMTFLEDFRGGSRPSAVGGTEAPSDMSHASGMTFPEDFRGGSRPSATSRSSFRTSISDSPSAPPALLYHRSSESSSQSLKHSTAATISSRAVLEVFGHRQEGVQDCSGGEVSTEALTSSSDGSSMESYDGVMPVEVLGEGEVTLERRRLGSGISSNGNGINSPSASHSSATYQSAVTRTAVSSKSPIVTTSAATSAVKTVSAKTAPPSGTRRAKLPASARLACPSASSMYKHSISATTKTGADAPVHSVLVAGESSNPPTVPRPVLASVRDVMKQCGPSKPVPDRHCYS